MTIESDAETEKSLSAESTVEESPQKIKKRKINDKKQHYYALDMSHQNNDVQQQQKHDPEYIKATKYPNLVPKSTKMYNDNSEELFCICRKPDNGDLMVGCDGCDDWYHFKCMKIDIKYQELIARYFCPYCEIDGKGTTLWKRKCRVRTCFKPILENNSKYCSKEHGLLYFTNLLDNKLVKQSKNAGVLNRDQVGEMVKISENIEQFKRLGDKMPDVPNNDFANDERIVNLRDSIGLLKEERDITLNKKKVLLKSRENVKKLNEALSANLDQGSSKKKAKKIDICGYDLIFNDDKFENEQLDESMLISNDTEQLKSRYEKYIEEEVNETSFCFVDKKKCQKHNGWQSVIIDDIELRLREIDQKIGKNEAIIEKIFKTLKMDFFEKQM